MHVVTVANDQGNLVSGCGKIRLIMVKEKKTAEMNKMFFLLKNVLLTEKKKRQFEKSINTTLIDQIELLLSMLERQAFTFKLKN